MVREKSRSTETTFFYRLSLFKSWLIQTQKNTIETKGMYVDATTVHAGQDALSQHIWWAHTLGNGRSKKFWKGSWMTHHRWEDLHGFLSFTHNGKRRIVIEELWFYVSVKILKLNSHLQIEKNIGGTYCNFLALSGLDDKQHILVIAEASPSTDTLSLQALLPSFNPSAIYICVFIYIHGFSALRQCDNI